MALTPTQRATLAKALKANSTSGGEALNRWNQSTAVKKMPLEQEIPDPFKRKPKPRSPNGAKQGKPIPNAGNTKPRPIPNAQPIKNSTGRYT